MYFASGEARAHLNHLVAVGRLHKQCDDRGIDIYDSTGCGHRMIRAFPFLFVILWSSAFISGKIIVEDASPFAALGFRFALVAFGFFCFALILKDNLSARSRDIFEACGTGILFHGLYLGGVFFAVSKGLPAGIAALIVSLQPVLTGALAGPVLGETVTWRQWAGIMLGFGGAALGLAWM